MALGVPILKHFRVCDRVWFLSGLYASNLIDSEK